MSSSMKAYLAEKYMSGPKADAILARAAPQKKKKRKHGEMSASSSSAAAIIVDEDALGWEGVKDSLDEEDAPEFVEESRGFKKKKAGGWATIREPTPPDEAPQLVLPDGRPLPPPAPPKPKARSPSPVQIATNPEQETVYRDSTGRRIDLSVERVEKKRREREEAEKRERQMEWGKGVVQREEAEKRRGELQEESKTGWARTADDKEMNRRLKEEDRWNDPAAAFLTKKTKGPPKPMYNGPPPPPNRFGIRPGYRWDGVDRGNGFEKKYFQRQNERQRSGREAYEWSVDDM